ncbi:hypothetical protein MKW92_001147, partial [Papaver armeniacum]
CTTKKLLETLRELCSGKFDATELDSLFTLRTFVGEFFSLDVCDYQQPAVI